MSLPFFRLIYPKNLKTFFLSLVISSISYVSIFRNVLNAPGATAQTISSDLSCIIHSLNSPAFTPPFFNFSTLALPNLQLQLHNCQFTTENYILQLQKLSSVAR